MEGVPKLTTTASAHFAYPADVPPTFLFAASIEATTWLQNA